MNQSRLINRTVPQYVMGASLASDQTLERNTVVIDTSDEVRSASRYDALFGDRHTQYRRLQDRFITPVLAKSIHQIKQTKSIKIKHNSEENTLQKIFQK